MENQFADVRAYRMSFPCANQYVLLDSERRYALGRGRSGYIHRDNNFTDGASVTSPSLSITRPYLVGFFSATRRHVSKSLSLYSSLSLSAALATQTVVQHANARMCTRRLLRRALIGVRPTTVRGMLSNCNQFINRSSTNHCGRAAAISDSAKAGDDCEPLE